MYLKNKDIKLFANASIFYVNNFNTQLKERGNSLSIQMPDNLNMALGAGVTYKKRLSLEFSYLPSANFSLSNSGELGWSSSFQSSSIVLGYSIF